MNAIATAARVLSWAAEPDQAPPTGPLWEVALLANPPAAVADDAARLARQTAARLGAGSPPFSDGRPSAGRIGLGVVFLAAAVGGRQQRGTAAQLAQAIPAAVPRRAQDSWYDLVARHGLVRPALTAFDGTGRRSDGHEQEPAPWRDEPLTDLLLDASPLTAVLYRPPLSALNSDATAKQVSTALALLARPRGRSVLSAGLAGWSPLVHVLKWRAGLLGRLRFDHPDLLLDVYLTARIQHGERWDDRVRWAARQLTSRGPVDPLALETLRFWAPLEAFERSAGPLSALRPLLSGYDQALKYVRAFKLDRVEAA